MARGARKSQRRRTRPEMGSINIYCQYGAVAWILPLGRRELQALVEEMAAAAGLEEAEFDLYVGNDSAIARINKEFLDCSGPTNAITFPWTEETPGSIYISADALERECALYGQKRFAHFLRLLAHGLGHMKGLDHGPEMELVESACLAAGLNQLNGGK